MLTRALSRRFLLAVAALTLTATAANADDVLYIPDNCAMFGRVDFEKLRDSAFGKEARKKVPGIEQEIAQGLSYHGLTFDKVARLTAGVVINPATPAVLASEILADVSLVLIMTVNPGFGGQEFIASTLPKIKTMRSLIDRVNPAIELEVDGGVEAHTARQAVEAGARVLVAGSSIFRHPGGVAAGMEALRAAVAGVA